jgi:PAS domain S-box-containing protein
MLQAYSFLGIGRDSTNRAWAEAERRAREIHLSNLFDIVADAIIMVDQDQRILVFNQGAEQIFGYRAQEVLGQPLDRLLPTRFAVAHHRHIHAFAAGPETARRMGQRQEVFGQRKDGTEFPAEASIAKLTQNGHIIFAVILRDISGRKRAEEALRQQAQIIDQIHDSVVSTDLDGYVTRWNKGAERLFGYSVQEALGQHISFIYPEDQHQFLQQKVIKPLKAKGNHEIEVQMRKKSGEAFYAHLSLSLLRNVEGSVIGMIGYSMETTERKRAEAELRSRAHQQAAIAELGQRALAGTDLATLMEEAVILVAQTLALEYTKILELLPDGEALLLRAGVGWMEGYVGHTLIKARTASQAGYTLLATEPVIVEDLRTETRFSGPPLLTDHRVVSGMSVIIHGHDRPFGILGAHTTQRRTFSTDDIHFLQAIANVLAAAIERKRAEAHLAYQAHLLANVHDAILASDEQFVLTAWNRAAEEMYGWKAEEVLGRKVQGVIRSEFSQAQRAGALRTLAERGHHRTEVVQYRKDGKPVYVEGTTIALKGEDGGITGYVSVNRDITERVQAEEALRQSVERLRILRQIDRAILGAQSLEEIALAGLRRIRALVPCLRASVVIFDLEASHGALLAAHVDGETSLGTGSQVPLEVFGDIEEFRQGNVHVVEDIQSLAQSVPIMEALHANGVRSYINIPLVARDELIGSLNLESGQPDAFSSEHVKIAGEVADPLAIAIQQARLFEWLSTAHERLQILSRRLVEVQETERRRIAHELHDEIGQTLTAVHINLQALQHPMDTTQLVPRLEESIDIVERALQQVRNLSLDLRPSLLDDLGLVATLRWYVDRQAQLGGFGAKFTADPLEGQVPPELEATCFRVVQEALTNVLRHAGATEICVDLQRHEADLQLVIHDNGIGFDVEAVLERAARGASLGLLGMQERVLLLGGQIDIQSAPGCGTEIRVCFPLPSSSPNSLPLSNSREN